MKEEDKIKLTKIDCDKMLMALIGSKEMVEQWWQGPNFAFDMRRPIDVLYSGDEGRQSVFSYLSEHCYGGYH